MNPHQATRDFEKALCEYTGSPYAVATTSCTMALLLAVAWHLRTQQSWPWLSRMQIEIPKYTYVGVPQAIIHAGGRPVFRDEDWEGFYQLKPLPVWDSARWFVEGMYRNSLTGSMPMGAMMCVSFHASKILADTQGGAILHDNPQADDWLRRARFDGRKEEVAPKDDDFKVLGWHAYISPDISARLLWKLGNLPKHNDPLPWGPGTNSDYPDLSKIELFK